MKMTYEELKKEMLKNPKKYIGEAVVSKSGIIGIIREINEEGIKIEPILNINKINNNNN